MNGVLPHNTRIAVLRGGTSSEFNLSLETGNAVLQSLFDSHDVSDVLIDKGGDWYVGGFKKESHDLIKRYDVFINALHGGYGEDGGLQKFLTTHGVSFTGADTLSSALSLKKHRSKSIFKRWGIKVPESITLYIDNPEEQAYSLFTSFAFPLVIKPISGGSSHGVQVALSFNELMSIFENASPHEEVLIEEYVFGTPVSCGIIENFRNEKEYTLFPVEIDVQDAPLYEHDKRQEYSYKCPSCLSYSTKKEIQRSTKQAFKALGLRHYGQGDFVVTKNGSVYMLEMNALPTLSRDASFTHALDAVGVDFPHFIEHISSLALQSK